MTTRKSVHLPKVLADSSRERKGKKSEDKKKNENYKN